MIERVVALFSIYISLAVVLMLLPVVFNFDYITTFDIPETNLFNIFNADAANLVIKTAFVLVLLAFLRVDKGAQVGADGKVDKGHPNDDAHMMGAPRIIERILMWSKGDISKGYLGQVGADVVKEVKDLASKATVFTPAGALKAVKGTALNVARTAVNAIPGKNIADRLIDHSPRSKKFKRDNDNMLNTAQADLLSKDTTKDIEAAAKDLSEATHDHSYMEEFQTARKDYWRQTPADVKRNRGKAGKTAERMTNVAKFGGGTKTKLGKLKRKERKVYKEKRKNRGI